VNDDLNAPTPQQPSGAPAAGTAAPAAPARRTLTRRVLGTLLPAVLFVGAVGGGIAYIKVTVDGADRTAPTALWQRDKGKPDKDPAGDADLGRTDTALSRQLLPVPEGYRLGPDVLAAGNDVSLSPQEAAGMMKDAGRGLPSELRKELSKGVDKLGVKGIGARSYTAASNELVVEITLTQVAHDKAATMHAEAALELPGEKKGPAVEGHKNARCFQAPKAAKKNIGSIRCAAYDGDLLVSVHGFGTTSFKPSAVAGLMRQQLDHITSPGTSV
jgi:hypothetical protein